MSTFDITLPTSQQVVFPPRCVVCEKQNPDSFIKLSFLGIKTTPLIAVAADELTGSDVNSKLYGTNTSNKINGIPACKGCVPGLKWYHRLLKFGYYIGWLPGGILILLGVPLFISITVLILGAISPGVFTLMFPPAFGASFWDSTANFEFKSKVVAEEFLALNSEAKLKNADKTKGVAASLDDAENSK